MTRFELTPPTSCSDSGDFGDQPFIATDPPAIYSLCDKKVDGWPESNAATGEALVVVTDAPRGVYGGEDAVRAADAALRADTPPEATPPCVDLDTLLEFAMCSRSGGSLIESVHSSSDKCVGILEALPRNTDGCSPMKPDGTISPSPKLSIPSSQRRRSVCNSSGGTTYGPWAKSRISRLFTRMEQGERSS